MNLKAKVFNEKDNMVYKILNIDIENKKVLVKTHEGNIKKDFKDLKWLEATEYKADKSFIYRDDFLLAVKGEEFLSGIVVKHKELWFLKNKKKGIFITLKELVEKGYKLVNRRNHKLYFAKKKIKEAE